MNDRCVAAAFGLVATILATSRFRPAATAYSFALFVTAGYWFTASTCFANPAVALAPAGAFAWIVRPVSRA